MKRLLTVIVFLAAILIVGWGVMQCQQQKEEPTSLAWYEDEESLMADLTAAIEDAQKLDSTKISHKLMPIRKDIAGEEWINEDGHDMVLVLTLVDSSRMERFFSGEGAYRIDRETGTWVSIPADWKSHKADFEGLDSVATHMRMLQLYGLSPDCDYDIFVLFYADPKGMFRPAHDPDITTTSVGLEFPDYADEQYTVGETNFREWYRYSITQAYEDDSPLPWTQMGYTYDWHKGAPREGLSEYIVSHHTLIKVKECIKANDFIKNL